MAPLHRHPWPRSLTWSLSTGLLLVAIAACNPTVQEPPATAPDAPPEMTLGDRAAYEELPLPEGAALVGDDPEQIALNIFGSTEPGEGNFAETVDTLEQSDTQAIVILTQTGLPDDSVEGLRYWLEFAPEGNQWRLDWAGRQSRCRPNRGHQDWAAELCL
jgi:hypothetical protein